MQSKNFQIMAIGLAIFAISFASAPNILYADDYPKIRIKQVEIDEDGNEIPDSDYREREQSPHPIPQIRAKQTEIDDE